MKNANTKQSLFEIMSRVDKSFKPTLNELFEETSTENDDLLEFIIPEWAISSLINGDDSGNSDEDDQKINKFISNIVAKFGNTNFMLGDIDGKDDLGFRHSNDIDNLGSNCYRLYLRPSK